MTDGLAAEPAPSVLDRLGRVLDGPLAGISPWIVLALVEGPGRGSWAAGLALALSVLFLVLDRVRGRSLKLLSVVDVVFFTGLLILVLLIAPAGQQWLETWIGEISNITLALIAAGSMLARMPFTLQYAREEVGREFWDSPVFLRVNYVITGAWGLAFLISSIAGFYGDAVLHNNNNLWTGWVIQVAALITAVEFTGWYPAVARAHATQALGHVPAEPAPPLAALLGRLVGWLIPIGILSLALDGGPTWLGIAFIAVGAVGSAYLRRQLAGTAAAGS